MSQKKIELDYAKGISEFQEIIKSLQLKTKIYKTLLRGRGLEFNGYRTYANDDDSSSIDWKASARGNKLLVKEYIEEKNLDFIFLIDVSSKMLFGSQNKLKCEYAAEILLAMSHLVMHSGNKFGIALYSDDVKNYILPRKGEHHFNLCIDLLSNIDNYGGASNLDNAVDFVLNLPTNNASSVIIISDFLKVNGNMVDKLNLLSKRFETFAIMVKDPLDRELPDFSGEVVVEDTDSKEQLLIDPSIARKQFREYAMQQENFVKSLFNKSDIDLLNLETNQNFVPELAEFLQERIRKGRYYGD